MQHMPSSSVKHEDQRRDKFSATRILEAADTGVTSLSETIDLFDVLFKGCPACKDGRYDHAGDCLVKFDRRQRDPVLGYFPVAEGN